MSKGLVVVPEDLAAKWATYQEPNSKIRIVVFDINVDGLVFQLIDTVDGTDNWENDFELAERFLQPASPCLIALRSDKKWILIAWIPEDSLVTMSCR